MFALFLLATLFALPSLSEDKNLTQKKPKYQQRLEQAEERASFLEGQASERIQQAYARQAEILEKQEERAEKAELQALTSEKAALAEKRREKAFELQEKFQEKQEQRLAQAKKIEKELGIVFKEKEVAWSEAETKEYIKITLENLIKKYSNVKDQARFIFKENKIETPLGIEEKILGKLDTFIKELDEKTTKLLENNDTGNYIKKKGLRTWSINRDFFEKLLKSYQGFLEDEKDDAENFKRLKDQNEKLQTIIKKLGLDKK